MSEPAPAGDWLPYLAACAGAKPPMRVPKWLVRLLAGEVAIKLRYADFTTLSRSRRLPQPANSAVEIARAAEGLLDALGTRQQAVRLIGIRAEQLVSEGSGYQLSFDRSDGNWRQAEETMDQIRARFPAGAVRPASLLPPGSDRAAPPGGGG